MQISSNNYYKKLNLFLISLSSVVFFYSRISLAVLDTNHDDLGDKVETSKNESVKNKNTSEEVLTQKSKEIPKEKGAYKIWDQFHYVSPLYVKDLRKYKNRMNSYAMLEIGPGVSIGNGESAFPTQVFGIFGLGLGAEFVFCSHFYFSFGVEMYSIIGSAKSNGAYEAILGYKFQFTIGGYLTPAKGPDTKLYLLYRDNQLQVGHGLSESFGYFSRNIGLGVAIRVLSGMEVGFESFFSLMHTNTIENYGTHSYPFVGFQVFAKLLF